MKKRVIVGLSGGVDSSVAAHLLIEQGYDVVGIFMRNWHDESVTINNECPWIEDSNDAMLSAQQLGIPFHVLDLSKEYYDRIVRYMFHEYESGRTPNPDILCNREIKFDVFLKAALNLKADFVATGHYARKDSFPNTEGKTIHRLMAGKDANKDQSYFLCQLTQDQLSHVLFPIGELTKPHVRKIAEEAGLHNAAKKDSQGLCFVGKVKLPTFLQQQLQPKKGIVIEVPASSFQTANGFHSFSEADESVLTEAVLPHHFEPLMGIKVGEHNGAHFYTIGQRRGLGVGGKAEPLFILETDVEKNIVYTGMGENHPGLLRNGLFIPQKDVHWVREDLAMKDGEQRNYLARIRYRQALTNCAIYQRAKGIYILFEEPQRGVARGQFAAWYEGDELIGSGVIS